MHATNSLKVILLARACAKKSFTDGFVMLNFCARDGICDVRYSSSCDFLAVKMVVSTLALRLLHFSFDSCEAARSLVHIL